MGTLTSNREYYKPALKEKGWGAVVNVSTDKVDVDVQANIDNIAANAAAMVALKADIIRLSSMVNGEAVIIAADRKTLTTVNPFIAGHKAVFIGNLITFDYTETLPSTITLNRAVEDVDIIIRVSYIRSDV